MKYLQKLLRETVGVVPRDVQTGSAHASFNQAQTPMKKMKQASATAHLVAATVAAHAR